MMVVVVMGMLVGVVTVDLVINFEVSLVVVVAMTLFKVLAGGVMCHGCARVSGYGGGCCGGRAHGGGHGSYH